MHSSVISLLLAMVVLLPRFAATAAETTNSPPPTYFFGQTNWSRFTRSTGARAMQVFMTSPEIETPIAWDQLVVSWNAETLPGSYLKFEARAIYPSGPTRFYTLGLWSEDDTQSPRESVTGQRDDDGEIKTDTLVLNRPARRAQVRITLTGLKETSRPELKFLGLSFLDSKATAPPREPVRAAWGKVIEVPERSQVPFGERQGWCSPTSTSMVLAHWANILNRPELNVPVPDVAKGVYDKNWPGTGNWPFNTAYAGKFPGLRGYVAQLNDISDLEEWILSDVPVVLSVSYDLLKGKTEPRNSGHIIVCVGFTKDGDLVVNDPWARLDEGQSVRKVFPRANLIPAWAASHNTAYLIYPESFAAKINRTP